jgi:3-methyladenine DNA glycosylase Mpg
MIDFQGEITKICEELLGLIFTRNGKKYMMIQVEAYPHNDEATRNKSKHKKQNAADVKIGHYFVYSCHGKNNMINIRVSDSLGSNILIKQIYDIQSKKIIKTHKEIQEVMNISNHDQFYKDTFIKYSGKFDIKRSVRKNIAQDESKKKELQYTLIM